MTMTASYIRPDQTYSTGVVAPYPIRTSSPVSVARSTVNPFVDMVRGVGLGDAIQAMAAARQVRNGIPFQNPQAVQTSNRNVTAELRSPVPGYLQYLYRAARAGQQVAYAQNYGSVGEISRAKQRQLRALGVRI